MYPKEKESSKRFTTVRVSRDRPTEGKKVLLEPEDSEQEFQIRDLYRRGLVATFRSHPKSRDHITFLVSRIFGLRDLSLERKQTDPSEPISGNGRDLKSKEYIFLLLLFFPDCLNNTLILVVYFMQSVYGWYYLKSKEDIFYSYCFSLTVLTTLLFYQSTLLHRFTDTTQGRFHTRSHKILPLEIIVGETT